jgi:hypothetical protein
MSGMIKNDVRYTREIKYRIALQKQRSKRTFFTGKHDLNLRKKSIKGCIWIIAFYSAKASTFWIVEVLKCGAEEG